MSEYLKGNRFIFSDECPDFTAEEVLSGLGLPVTAVNQGNIKKAFDSVKDEVRSLVHLAAGAVFFKMPDKTIPPVPAGTGVAGVMLTLGSDVTSRADSYVAMGEYTKGLVINEISDYCLISYEKMIVERLQVLSDRKGMKLLRMYEAPEDMPFSELRYVWNALRADKNLGINITRDSTLYPTKSSCFILKVEDNGIL